VGPRTGLDNVEKRKDLPLTGLELRPFCSQARSLSLYYAIPALVDSKKRTEYIKTDGPQNEYLIVNIATAIVLTRKYVIIKESFPNKTTDKAPSGY
jgi:hypothetical protein